MRDVSSVAIVTPSFARDFLVCRDLNESVMRYTPKSFRHYILVDRSDVALFKNLANSRTVVAAIEDMIPSLLFKAPLITKRWLSLASRPLTGWHVQQIVKISAAAIVAEPTIVNVDSDVQFIRKVDASLFVREGKTRLYRLSGGITNGMSFQTRMLRNMSRLFRVPVAPLPADDYIGNVISWNRELVLQMCAYLEQKSGLPWYISYMNTFSPAEQAAYGLFAEKVIGANEANVFIDDGRSCCHTYWKREPLSRAEDIDAFVAALQPEDVAVSIEGYSKTVRAIEQATIERVKRRAWEQTPSLV